MIEETVTRGLLAFESHYSGLVAAAKKMDGFVIEREEEVYLGVAELYLGVTERGTITISLPPVRYFSDTYWGMYCLAEYSFSPRFREAKCFLYQKVADIPRTAHPHLYDRDTGVICWHGAEVFKQALKNLEYEMALLALYQSVCTVEKAHWRRGLSICQEPGCLMVLEKALYDYCEKHQKHCLWCGKTRFRIIGNSGYCKCCYGPLVTCVRCKKHVPDERASKIERVASALDCEYQDFRQESVFICEKCRARGRAKCNRCGRTVPNMLLVKVSRSRKLCAPCYRSHLFNEYSIKEDEKWKQRQEQRSQELMEAT